MSNNTNPAADWAARGALQMAPDADITFERIGVTPAQIHQWRLPSRPTKATDSRAKGFGDISVELDAIRPDVLRDLVEGVIQVHLPAKKFKVLMAAEESERELLRAFCSGEAGR